MENFVRFLSVAFLSFVAGVMAIYLQWIPKSALDFIWSGGFEIASTVDRDVSWYTQPLEVEDRFSLEDEQKYVSAATLVTGAESTTEVTARIFSADGQLLQRWLLDWFEIFPDPSHLEEEVRPKSRPGTHPHGAAILPNGDLVFNFEYMGMARLNSCGDVVWTLPYQTHHSIYIDDNGDIWAAGSSGKKGGSRGNLLSGATIVRISPDSGEIQEEHFVLPIFPNNDIEGLQFITGVSLTGARKIRDVHLNDVEVFSNSLEPGFFQPGDIMISLRNLNLVLVLERDARTVKKVISGPFIRHHDPDFIDGNTIILYDNNHRAGQEQKTQSRILRYSVLEDRWETLYEGSDEDRFFSAIMGKQQPLDNGHILVTESMRGRAFEINTQGEIVWDFVNDIGDGYVGVMEEAQRLDRRFDAAFYEAARVACQGSE